MIGWVEFCKLILMKMSNDHKNHSSVQCIQWNDFLVVSCCKELILVKSECDSDGKTSCPPPQRKRPQRKTRSIWLPSIQNLDDLKKTAGNHRHLDSFTTGWFVGYHQVPHQRCNRNQLSTMGLPMVYPPPV